LGALENGEIRGRITANQRRGHDAAASDGQVNLLVAAQCVLRSDDYSFPPNHAARRAARFRMHSYSGCGGKLRDLRESIRKFNQFCRHFPTSMNKMHQKRGRLHPPIGQVRA
jgi:hypothetical protein